MHLAYRVVLPQLRPKAQDVVAVGDVVDAARDPDAGVHCLRWHDVGWVSAGVRNRSGGLGSKDGLSSLCHEAAIGGCCTSSRTQHREEWRERSSGGKGLRAISQSTYIHYHIHCLTARPITRSLPAMNEKGPYHLPGLKPYCWQGERRQP